MDNKQTVPIEEYKNAIAVIGMAGKFPGADNLSEFWSNLKNGVESISFFTNEELLEAGLDSNILEQPNYIKAKGIVDKHDYFDANFFNYSAHEADVTDPQLRLLLECSREAIEAAGYSPEIFDGKIGAFIGTDPNYNWVSHVKNNQKINSVDRYENDFLFLRDFVSTTISYKLNLKGPSLNILTACSTSLVTIHYACKSLLAGECEMAIAGGSTITFPSKVGYLHVKDSFVSSDGHCRAFDEKADGTVWGDGVGIVVLKPLYKAIKDKDCIHSIIKGSAVNNDGDNKFSYTASSKRGQVEVIKMAQECAKINLDTISYVETHSTGTSLGDMNEVQALKEAFNSTQKGFCAIGSLKSNIGHLSAAAGVAGFIKIVLALKHKQIPPTLHVTKPNPRIKFLNSPFYVNTKLSQWDTNALPRRAAITTLGFGGTNANIILEEGPILTISDSFREWNLLTLSAKTKDALENSIKKLTKFLYDNIEISVSDVSYTLAAGRTPFNYRLALVCKNRNDAIQALINKQATDTYFIDKNHEQRILFMFPLLGSQHANMGSNHYKQEPFYKNKIDYCAKILGQYLDIDFSKILYPTEDAEEEASLYIKTTLSHPAHFIFSYSLAKLWIEWGVKPSAIFGLGMGELVAACLANVISLEDVLAIIGKRCKFMKRLGTPTLLSVAMQKVVLSPLLDKEILITETISPSHCVLSEPVEKLEQIKAKLCGLGIECEYVQTSSAFQTKMLDQISYEIEQLFQDVALKTPCISIMSSITGSWLTDEDALSSKYWLRSFGESVNFSFVPQDFQLLEIGEGVTLRPIAECGEDTDSFRQPLSVLPHNQAKKTSDEHILTVLGKLWLTGSNIQWNKYFAGREGARISLPTYPYEREQFGIRLTTLEKNKKFIETKFELKNNLSESDKFSTDIDNQSIGGFVIDLERIKRLLLEREDIIDAEVLLIENEIVAFVILQGISLNVFSIKKYLRSKLTEEMIPSSIFKIDKIPKNLLGRPDRVGLMAKASIQSASIAISKIPQTHIEKEIANIWKSILNIDMVNLDDNFFDLGGHSLLLVRNNEQIENILGLSLPLNLFFNNTLRQISREIEEHWLDRKTNH